MFYRVIIAFMFWPFVSTNIGAQEARSGGIFIVGDVHIEGNKKTKAGIILRELGFKKGDSLPQAGIGHILQNAKQQLVNTSLFLSVSVDSSSLGSDSILVKIIVKERWYIFPAPVFSLADRNFSVWWRQQKRDLGRVSYGFSVDWNNVTGHNDHFIVALQTGYSKSWAVLYNRPNIGRGRQHEIGFRYSYTRDREVNYASMLNRKSFVSNNNFLRKLQEFRAYYSFRKNIYTRHYLSAGYTAEQVGDTIASLNPEYFGSGKTTIGYSELTYRFSYNNTNNVQYPLTGRVFSLEILRNGLLPRDGINLTQLKVDAGLFLKLFRKTYFNSVVGGKIFLPKQQPFVRFRGLGYNDKELVRGLDEYVLDGNAYAILKANLKRELLSFNTTIKLLPRSFRKVPIQIFVKSLFDVGYVNNHNPGNNTLVNRWLFTYGAGIDVVSYYDMNMTFEYNFNQWMEQGLFFRIKFGL
jgi:hypothetical protein